ncbi:SH3 domain-containing protein [Faunimonas sp. B44]|uniref:SH3 domain-containing protein n=1 Tax=Faunimonas sp. B44 TaxID=3461493 RepID=UPI004044E327
MMRRVRRGAAARGRFGTCARAVVFAAAALTASVGHADLRYELIDLPGLRALMVSGPIDASDDLGVFAAEVRRRDPEVIVFNSPGGSVMKAMELGRMIRVFRLNTVQPRAADCASACALAFLGGVNRAAEPGAIGVHKSSFSHGARLSAADAVSSVQQLTAEVIAYIIEMGADPSLLQLSLRYEANDIRYLSMSEMQQYGIVSGGAPGFAARPPRSDDPGAGGRGEELQGRARSGRVRHPKGFAEVKVRPDDKAAARVQLANHTPIKIVADQNRWYEVDASGVTGFMHHTWVFVDQYEQGPFDSRYIQVKSFDNIAQLRDYARQSPFPLAGYLATNGWYAATLAQRFAADKAAAILRDLKSARQVPPDSIITYGNTYVRKVCCD